MRAGSIMQHKGRWTNPRSGSRVFRRRVAHGSACVGCGLAGLDHCRACPTMAKVCARKLSGEAAKREVPDTVVPTHSTESRGPFATLGESSRYFNCPKTSKTQKPKICATLALVVPV